MPPKLSLTRFFSWLPELAAVDDMVLFSSRKQTSLDARTFASISPPLLSQEPIGAYTSSPTPDPPHHHQHHDHHPDMSPEEKKVHKEEKESRKIAQTYGDVDMLSESSSSDEDDDKDKEKQEEEEKKKKQEEAPSTMRVPPDAPPK